MLKSFIHSITYAYIAAPIFVHFSSIVHRELDGILERIKWPFPTGISSPMICDSNDEEILSKFASVVRQVLRISSQYPYKFLQTKMPVIAYLLLTINAIYLKKHF